ncbi:universal stress protein [Tomitella fengzijianii]|uniref:universal stress protein n=1 Tax=Tomitella fengzijianii TaxID=2597660 RepID=UPI00131D3455|nr:universal stress protein [Tomitella fengzijianii]
MAERDSGNSAGVTAGTVCVGVDGSEGSARAVRWAARYAAAGALPLQLLYVVTVPSVFYSEPMAARFVEDERTRIGEKILREAAAAARAAVDGADLVIDAGYEVGSPSEVLIDRTADARLLVMGTRGHGELTGLFVGSVTRAIVGHAHCPVAVIPGLPDGVPDPSDRPDAPVVVGVDGSEAGLAALDFAYAEAEARGAELVAVHVWSDAGVHPRLLGSRADDPYWLRVQRTEEERLRSLVEERSARHPGTWVHQVVERENPAKILAEWSAHAQMVVTGSRGRGGFAGLVLGSTSHALLHRSKCPLVVLRPRG